MSDVKPNHTFSASVIDVYDGDTLCASVCPFPHKKGYDVWLDKKCRLARINAPEMKDPDPAVQARAIKARDFVRAAVLANPTVVIVIKGADTYERDIAEVYYQEDGGAPIHSGVQKNLSDELLAAGLVVPYGGKL